MTVLQDFDLIQHVKEPTHVAGHTLDIVITHKTFTMGTVLVEEPVISDHSLISFQVLSRMNNTIPE